MAKMFTLSEAEALLPVLRSLLETARAALRQGEEIDAQLQRIVTRVLLLGGAEIEAAGVQLKDLNEGLLDFPCLREGRVVLLCWKLGEERIEHWHGTDEGFAGRKKIDRARFPSGSPPRLN